MKDARWEQTASNFVSYGCMIVGIATWSTGFPIYYYGTAATLGAYKYWFSGNFEEAAMSAEKVCEQIAMTIKIFADWETELDDIKNCVEKAEAIVKEFGSL